MNALSSGGGISVFSNTAMSGLKRPCPENSEDSSDSDSECTIVPQDMLSGVGSNNGTLFIDGPKPGKKTKGRVKIKMEFIENKLRRYTTFSKRKTGIMKKAYELSTLTGTQVMLLVASETGHVYTFATRKLQPMITSESGKALIQTCLNSPDSPLDVGKVSNDQRMNPTGYEETDLSYAVSDDETCQPASTSPYKAEVVKSSTPSSAPSSLSSRCQVGATSSSSSSVEASSSHQLLYQLGQDMAAAAASSRPLNSVTTISDLRLKQEPTSNHTSYTKDSGSSHSQQQSEVLVSRASAAAATSASLPNSAYSTAALSMGTSSPLVMSSAALHQNQPTPGQHPSQLQPTFYKIPGTNQIISLAFTGASSQGTVLYQTYTAPSSSGISPLPEGYLLNLPQAPALSKAIESSNGAAQQFITIPVPVSLANSSQMFHPLFAQSAASIKSELLPTDLRYNSLEKPAK